jgi:Protein of unknown function (DUF2889)
MSGSSSRRTVRRITCADAVRPDGVLGPLEVRGLLIDEIAEGDVQPTLFQRQAVEVGIDFLAGATITSISTTSEMPELSELIGHAATRGFRPRLHQLVEATDLNQGCLALLEDLPNVTMLSRVILVMAPEARDLPARRREPHIDICAGWVAGGELALRPEGDLPAFHPFRLQTPDEQVAWAALPVLPPASFRRHRVTEVRENAEDPTGIRATSWFYDVVRPQSGEPLVLHNYRVRADVAAGDHRVTACTADPGPLPTSDCHAAASSSEWLVGLALPDIYSAVREKFKGTSTCTHLNEQLRSLSDVTLLTQLLHRETR